MSQYPGNSFSTTSGDSALGGFVSGALKVSGTVGLGYVFSKVTGRNPLGYGVHLGGALLQAVGGRGGFWKVFVSFARGGVIREPGVARQ